MEGVDSVGHEQQEASCSARFGPVVVEKWAMFWRGRQAGRETAAKRLDKMRCATKKIELLEKYRMWKSCWINFLFICERTKIPFSSLFSIGLSGLVEKIVGMRAAQSPMCLLTSQGGSLCSIGVVRITCAS